MLSEFDHFSWKYIAFKASHIVAGWIVIANAEYLVARSHRDSAAYLCRLEQQQQQ
jgi:hypothetical protein